MNKKGLILLLSALTVGLAQENETCQTSEVLTLIQENIDELKTETVPETADKSVQKMEKSMNNLFQNVETLLKPIAAKQERINKTVTDTVVNSIDNLFQKVETGFEAKQECLSNETVTDIVEKSIDSIFQREELLTNETVTEIVKKSIDSIFQREELLTNETVTEIVKKSMEKLFEKVETLIAAKQECVSNETVSEIVKKSMEKLFERVETLIAAKPQLLGVSPDRPATSCKEILRQNKDSLSDHYWLTGSNGVVIEVFCDMTRTCGGITGGWMKVAQLDTTKNPHQCPHPLYLNTQHGKNLCARRETAGGCSEVHYQANGVAYSEVCGKVIAYQFGSTDGPASGRVNGVNINGAYIDGVSITHSSPRQHIWTFLAARDESGEHEHPTCPCSNRNSPGSSPPSLVGNDYFCDSGSKQRLDHPFRFYPDDPLWDGTGCGPNSDCCTFQNPPWFYKKLGASTRDSVDMRVCRNERADNEDVLLEKVALYVR